VGCRECLGGFTGRGKMLVIMFWLGCYKNLHPSPDIDFAMGDFRRTKENVSTVATRAIHPYRVLAAMGGGAIEGDFTALVAVRCIGRPCGRVQPFFETLRDLTKRKWYESKGKNSSLVEHFADDDSIFEETVTVKVFLCFNPNLHYTTVI
jgi:hypothetical protein